MKISVPTNHNYYEEKPLVENQLKKSFGAKNKKESRHITEQVFSSTYQFTTKKESLEQIKIFGFKEQRNKLEDEEQLILKLYAKESNTEEKKYIVQTGLFAGTIYHKDVQFNIATICLFIKECSIQRYKNRAKKHYYTK